MISVVAPTMWTFPPFLDFVKYILKMEIVDEFILINNAPDRTPDHPILEHSKMRVLNFGKNIGCNPAWNAGVEAAKNDIICIMNDDIIFDLKVFYKIDEFLTTDMGAIGLMSGKVEYGQMPVTTGEIFLIPYQGQNPWGYGELFFVHKKTWEPIPDGLDIAFGEVFTFDRFYFSGKVNYFIANLMHYHQGNATMLTIPKPEREEIFARECKIYEQVKAELIARGS